MRTYSRVQSFPNLDSSIPSPAANRLDQPFVSKLNNLQQFQGCCISADCLSKILEAAMIAQKMGMRMAIDVISPTTCNNSDWKFINQYLDSTVLLLDACNNVQLRLESIRSCLDSIPIGLHYLEGEHEPSKVVQKSGEGVSPELYKALSSSWAMAVFAIGVLSSATSFSCVQTPKTELWTTLVNQLNNKIKVFPKKPNGNASMEELASVDLAAQSFLKLISTWKENGNSSLRRLTVKAVAGELRRRKEELEKRLPLLEENIGELYRQIVALRISLFGFLSKACKEEVFELVKYSTCEESKMDIDVAQYKKGVAWVKAKTKATKRCSSFGRIGPHCIGFLKNRRIKNRSLNV